MIASDIVLVNNDLSILGSYAEWTHEDSDKENYCPYLPFMFSFVLLIVKWSLVFFFCLAALLKTIQAIFEARYYEKYGASPF